MSLELSTTFREALYEIREESKVADALMSRFTLEAEGNFLAYGRGQISFLPTGTSGGPNNYTHPARQSGRAARVARRWSTSPTSRPRSAIAA